MDNIQFKGQASVEGIPGSFDAIVWLPQTGKWADNFEEETIKDQHGFDVAWLARNQHLMADISMKVVGMNGAAKAALTAQPFPLLPLTTVTLTLFAYGTDPSAGGGLNGQYQYMSGADLSLTFDKVNEATFKLRKYVDQIQNALANTLPG